MTIINSLINFLRKKDKIGIKTEEELGLVRLLSDEEAKEKGFEPDKEPKLLLYEIYNTKINLLNALNETKPQFAQAFLLGESYNHGGWAGDIYTSQAVQFYKKINNTSGERLWNKKKIPVEKLKKY